MRKLLLVGILMFAFALRIYGLNWDQNQHLHPDERFLTMVAAAQKLPTSITQYLDPHASGLNPANVGFPFYVYGTFPVTIVKYVANHFDKDSYDNLALVGRGVSALFDVGIVFFVFAITALFEKKYRWNHWIKYTAAFLYAVMVLPIQQSHFFTVDTFVTFFMFGGLYFAVAYYFDTKTTAIPKGKTFFINTKKIIACGVFIGFAIASKINAVYIVPLIVLLFWLPLLTSKEPMVVKKRELLYRSLWFLVFIFVAYITLRFADPYVFATSNFFVLRPNPTLLNNIHQLQSFNNPSAWFPPGVQWITKMKIIFPLQNIIFFGMGPALFIIAISGLLRMFKQHRPLELMCIYGWGLLLFIYLGMQYSMNMRYFYILYPLLAIPAAFLLIRLHEARKKFVFSIVLMCILIWPLMFMAIYTRPHSRVTASQWIYMNIPAGSILAQEHWDDSLPLPHSEYSSQQYTTIQMPVFGPDDDAKWKEVDDALQKSQYIVFTSNRGYGSISTVPDRYPRMSKFYDDLFAGKLEFRKIKEFTSYPGLTIGGIAVEIHDQWSEEAFTVYDHPKVTIFKKI